MKKTKLKLFASIIGIISLLSLGIVGCVSPRALSIEISSPEDGATVSESPITVTGTVSGYPRGEVAVGEQTARLVPEVTVNGVKADVDTSGGFSAQVELAEGENTIEAVAMLNNMETQDSIAVTYTPPAPMLTSIAVEPALPDNLAVGATQQFTATGTYSDNSTADITSEVTWASSDEAVATIDAAGLATGVAEGTADITASLSGVTSPAVTLTVVVP